MILGVLLQSVSFICSLVSVNKGTENCRNLPSGYQVAILIYYDKSLPGTQHADRALTKTGKRYLISA